MAWSMSKHKLLRRQHMRIKSLMEPFVHSPSLKAIKKQLNRKGIVLHPPIVNIELTNHCNLRCAMCPIRLMNRNSGYMDIDLFKQLCDQSRKFRMSIIWLSFYGEPLLYPHLEDALSYFKENGFGIGGISTNGLLLDDRHRRIIIDNCALIRVAVDSTDEGIYRILRNNDNFALVCENTKKLIALSTGSDLNIEVQWLRTRLNEDEGIKSFRALFGIHEHVKYISKECGIYAPGGPDLTTESHKRFRTEKCNQPFHYLNVTWTGDCVLCCQDINAEQNVGNVQRNSLFKIWCGRKARVIRSGLMNSQFSHLPLCQRCMYKGATCA